MSLPRVFISYTDIDKKGKRFALKLGRVLKQCGYDIFLFDHSKKHHYGENIWNVLTHEIEKSPVLLIICTEAITLSYGSDFEINQALSRRKLIVPLQFDEAEVPAALVIKTREQFDENNFESKFAAIAKELPELSRRYLRDQKQQEKAIEEFKRMPAIPPRVSPPEGGKQLLDSIVEAYQKGSVIECVSVLESFDISLHSALAFGVIGLRVPIPRDWIGDPGHYILVDNFGESVAWGERNHLRDIWREHVRTEIFSLSRFTFQEFRKILNDLSSGMNAKVLLAPIDMFAKFMSIIRSAPVEVKALKWDAGKSFFVLEDGRELRILWSNKYAPLDQFVLVDPSATRWRVKPDPTTGDRLTAVFVENEKDPTTKIDILVGTQINAELVNPNGVKRFKFE